MVPADFQRQRRDTASKVLDSAADVVDTVEALTADDAAADLDPSAAGSFL